MTQPEKIETERQSTREVWEVLELSRGARGETLINTAVYNAYDATLTPCLCYSDVPLLVRIGQRKGTIPEQQMVLKR